MVFDTFTLMLWKFVLWSSDDARWRCSTIKRSKYWEMRDVYQDEDMRALESPSNSRGLDAQIIFTTKWKHTKKFFNKRRKKIIFRISLFRQSFNEFFFSPDGIAPVTRTFRRKSSFFGQKRSDRRRFPHKADRRRDVECDLHKHMVREMPNWKSHFDNRSADGFVELTARSIDGKADALWTMAEFAWARVARDFPRKESQRTFTVCFLASFGRREFSFAMIRENRRLGHFSTLREGDRLNKCAWKKERFN